MDINGKTSIGLSPQKRKCKEWKKKTEQIFLSGRSFKKRSISYIKKRRVSIPDTQSSLTLNLIP
jgi:hypothetical protein